MSIQLVISFIILMTHKLSAVDVDIINQWNLLDFNFPSNNINVDLNFRPENTLFTGLEITDDRIFLAMPRLYSGVPATLATIPRGLPLGSSPKLDAYPNWDIQNANCSGLISVYRIRKDSCNRLWVLDAGVMTSLENFNPVCPPKIFIFDLSTDQMIRSVVFPRDVLRPNSLFTNLIIDESIQGGCDRSFIYISDTTGPGLVVYDSLKETAWRVSHPLMYPDPDFSDTTIQGETFTLMDGIVGLAHSPNLGVLYFQPLATDRIMSIRTNNLIRGPLRDNEVLAVNEIGRKSSQGVGLAFNEKEENLYFAPMTETSIALWNPLTNQYKLLSYNPELLQFLAELRWNSNDNSIWGLSTKFHKFYLRNLNSNEINLRIVHLRTSTHTPFVLNSVGSTTHLNNNYIYFKK